MRRIGVLMNLAADDKEGQTRLIAFVQALSELGWKNATNVQILLQNSLMFSGNSDSVSVMRFAVEASYDGAAQSRSRAVVLFIST
jgi:hypothetical protein